MTVLGGIVGAIVGFGVGLLVTEVIIGNPANQSGFDWILVTDIAFTTLGALAGVSLVRRRTSAKASRVSVP